MKVLTVAWLISIFAFSQSFGQPDSRHMLMVNNKTYKPMKEIHIGDEVRLILTNSTKVKGYIISIDSTFFTVDNNFVRLSDIRKISTKKRGVQLLGGVLIAGGIASFASWDPCISLYGNASSCDNGLFFLGLGLTGAGVAVVGPGYHKIGKSKRLMLISGKPND